MLDGFRAPYGGGEVPYRSACCLGIVEWGSLDRYIRDLLDGLSTPSINHIYILHLIYPVTWFTFFNSHTFTMSFHVNAEELRVDDDHILVGKLPNEDGDLVDAEIDLSEFIGNEDGTSLPASVLATSIQLNIPDSWHISIENWIRSIPMVRSRLQQFRQQRRIPPRRWRGGAGPYSACRVAVCGGRSDCSRPQPCWKDREYQRWIWIQLDISLASNWFWTSSDCHKVWFFFFFFACQYWICMQLYIEITMVYFQLRSSIS